MKYLLILGMTLPLILLILISFSFVGKTNAIEPVTGVLTALHITKLVVSGVGKTWNIVHDIHDGESIITALTEDKSRKVLRSIGSLSRKIESYHEQYETFADYTIELMHNFKKNSALESELNEVKDIIDRITVRAAKMTTYDLHQDSLENDTLIKFAEWNVQPNAFSINHLLERLHLLFVGHKRGSRSVKHNIIQMMSDHLSDARDQLCVTNQSAQQFLYSLYSDVAYTELKGFTMMQFSYMMLRIHGKGNYTKESNLVQEEFIKRVEQTQKALAEVMKRADRNVWKCDPKKHIKGVTYDEVTRLLQGYIENEADLNEDGTCRENCGYYQISKSHSCYQNLFCSQQQRCTGKLVECQFVQSDMSVCQAPLNSSRRYDYVQYKNGQLLGEKNVCSRNTNQVDSWWRWLFWHCSYCFCLCDEQSVKSDRYFNLRDIESDIDKNMVVTGIRFIKVKRIFHLQIQQGELLPNGNINLQSVHWKPNDEYQIFDRNVKSTKDYHTLTWDNRAIDLDEITGKDPTHIITGVRFRVLGAHLNLEAKLSEYDFESGKLIDPQVNSFWHSNDNTTVGENGRKPITLRSPDVPTRSRAKSSIMSQHNQYIEFVNSDIEKDAAQTTVPFIDIQEVVSNPPVPLSGIGIYYKGQNQYGGFLGPKIITYDFTPHVQSPFKPQIDSK